MIQDVVDREPGALDPWTQIFWGQYHNWDGHAAQDQQDDPDGDGDALPVPLAGCRSDQFLEIIEIVNVWHQFDFSDISIDSASLCMLIPVDNSLIKLVST